MKKIRVLVGLFVLSMLFMVAMPECLALKRVVPEKNADAIIEKYLKNHQLDAVEGIWDYHVNGNEIRLAIIKDPQKGWADYVGVSLYGAGKPGEGKIYLKKTNSPGVFTGSYVVQGNFGAQQEQTSTFVMPADGVMEARVPYFGLLVFARVDNFNRNGSNSPAAPKSGSGTGFFIGKDLVATNAHVIDGAKRITVFQGNAKATATLVRVDKANDIAVLRVNGMENMITPLPIGNPNNVNLGERVRTVGFPRPDVAGYSPQSNSGEISALTGLQDDIREFQISVPIEHGSSGGPLVNKYGQVIGITSGGIPISARNLRGMGTVPQNMNVAVKISYLMNLLPDFAYSNATTILSDEEVTRRTLNAVVFVWVEG